MRLLVKGIGVCTARFANSEQLLDALCDVRQFDKYKAREDENSIAKALVEAGVKEGTTLLYVKEGETTSFNGTNILTFKEALDLAGTFEEAAIVCTQNGLEGKMDAIVIQTTTNEKEPAYAAIESFIFEKAEDSTLFEQFYGKDGAVCESGNVVCGCFAIYYNLRYPFETEKEYILEFSKWSDYTCCVKTNSSCSCKLKKVSNEKNIKKKSEYGVVPIAFESLEEAVFKLEQLESSCESMNLYKIMETALGERHDGKTYKIVVFIAKDKKDLISEIESFLTKKDKWFLEGYHWSTLNGSFYTASPLGNDAKICMMNPPGGSFVKGAFYRLYRTIPELQESVSKMVLNLDTEDELILRYSFEILATRIVLDALHEMGFQPDALLGGSLGEISLPLALGCIVSDTCGDSVKKNTINEYANIIIKELDELLKSQGTFSQRYFKRAIKDMEKWYLKCDLNSIKEAVDKEGKYPKVFITIIGSPNDVLIMGMHDACARVIERVKCFCTQLDDAIYAHTPILEHGRKKIKNAFIKLAIHLRENLPYDIYSTTMIRKMDASIDMYAENFANCIINQVNMPEVLNYAYEEKCRLFIDLGTNRLCSQWAKETFSDSKDVFVASLFDESKCKDGLLLFLAQMISNRITFDSNKILERFHLIDKEEVRNKTDKLEVSESKVLEMKNAESYTNEFIDVKSEVVVSMPVKEEKPECKDIKTQNRVVEVSESEITGTRWNRPVVKKSIIDKYEEQSNTDNANNMKKVDKKGYGKEKKVASRGYVEELAISQFHCNQVVFRSYLDYQRTLVKWLMEEHVDSVIKNLPKEKKACLYDYDEVLEMTNGSMAKVLGEQYLDVDKYPIRARMPSPPFMFITRILDIHAKFGELTPGCNIEAEYDVKEDCILRVGEREVSPLVFGEASHIGIFLTGYMGIDSISNGTAKFRVTDTDTTYQEQRNPIIGETARVKFSIERFVNNGDMTLIFCNYQVYLNNVLCIAAKEIGGFFTQEILDKGMGIREKLKEYSGSAKNPPYLPVSTKRSFSKEEVLHFLQGNPEKCFGVPCVNCTSNYQVSEELYLLDRIVDISSTGGVYGLGSIIGEKEIDESFWAFKYHFKNDPILPGTIMLEGVTQVSIFFQIYQGLFNGEKTVTGRFEPNNTVKNTFRGEVRPGKHTLRFRIDPKEFMVKEYGYRFVHDSSVFCDGVYVISQKNAVVQIIDSEKL